MYMKRIWSQWFIRDADKKKALKARLDFAMTQNTPIKSNKGSNSSKSSSVSS